jgi:Na+/H+ antiporter
MAIFFLLVTLEIKREMLVGQLCSRSKISLPVIAALGGIVVRALIYSLLNWGDDINMKGWAIPTATDIAFALGVIILLGNRIPEILKLTLVAIAIIDDLAAIVIIAFFYTEELTILPIVIALISMIVLFILNKKHVHKLSPYIIIGFILWVFVLKSGIHATLARGSISIIHTIQSNISK